RRAPRPQGGRRCGGGGPAPGFLLGEVTVEPARLRISGPRSEVLRLSEVLTETIDVAGATPPLEKKVKTTPGGLHVRFDGGNEVTVRIDIVPIAPEPEPPAKSKSRGEKVM